MYRYIIAAYLLMMWACKTDTTTSSTAEKVVDRTTVPFPKWADDATMYEVNVRQYTEEGTLAAFADQIPRLGDMGIEILWFMPIYPISVERRKGPMGSYYAISDYTAINPEMGTMDDFKSVLNKAHERDMKVIIDWVPNHTGWDHAWIKDHPEWYEKDSTGAVTHPEDTDWYDVASLNYDNEEMVKAMIADMGFWVTEVGIDGFRCDVAHNVPDAFWKEVSLHFAQEEKPLLFLAESDHPPHRNEGYFHLNYGWHLHHIMNEIAKGEKTMADVAAYLKENEQKHEKGFHLHFTSNHDENSWKGSAIERFGDLHELMNVFAFTFQGMPLIYSGQEAGLDRKLAFFDKDEIEWGTYDAAPFFKSLIDLKKENESLYNRVDRANTQILYSEGNVIHYRRQSEGNKVDVIMNASDSPQEYVLVGDVKGKDYFGKNGFDEKKGEVLTLQPFGYMVVVER